MYNEISFKHVVNSEKDIINQKMAKSFLKLEFRLNILMYYFEWYKGKINIYELCVKLYQQHHQNYISGILIALSMCYLSHHHNIWSWVVVVLEPQIHASNFLVSDGVFPITKD